MTTSYAHYAAAVALILFGLFIVGGGLQPKVALKKTDQQITVLIEGDIDGPNIEREVAINSPATGGPKTRPALKRKHNYTSRKPAARRETTTVTKQVMGWWHKSEAAVSKEVAPAAKARKDPKLGIFIPKKGTKAPAPEKRSPALKTVPKKVPAVKKASPAPKVAESVKKPACNLLTAKGKRNFSRHAVNSCAVN